MTTVAPVGSAPQRRYSASKDQLIKRIEGQVRGFEGMVSDDRYCIDVVTQIPALEAALDKVALGPLGDHARHCLNVDDAGQRADRTDDVMDAVARLMRRR